jgi:hypothetical protein
MSELYCISKSDLDKVLQCIDVDSKGSRMLEAYCAPILDCLVWTTEDATSSLESLLEARGIELSTDETDSLISDFLEEDFACDPAMERVNQHLDDVARDFLDKEFD